MRRRRRGDRRRLPLVVRSCWRADSRRCAATRAARRGPRRGGGRRRLRSDWQARYPLDRTSAPLDDDRSDGPLQARSYVVETIAATPRPRTPSSSAGVGQHQMWAVPVLALRPPLHVGQLRRGRAPWASRVPAAIGAKVGRPDRTVWAIDGDGCFQMTAQELVTARAERIPVKIAILNNAYLGMVRQWQEMFYDERYSEVYLSPDLPDYVKWAEAMGCVGIRARVDPRRWHRPSTKANAIDDRPVVIDFRTDAVGEGLPDGRRRRVQRRHHGPPRPARSRPDEPADDRPRTTRPHTPVRHHILSVLVENKAGVLARVAGPLRPAGLQHLLPGRRPDRRRRALQPHHHRRRRRSRRRSSRSCSQLDKLVNVVVDHRPRAGRRRRAGAAARHRRGRADGAVPGDPAGRRVRGRGRRRRDRRASP